MMWFGKEVIGQSSYNISVVERLKLYNINPFNDAMPATTEIRSLFIKVGSEWRKNNKYLKMDTFYQIKRGQITAKIPCYRKVRKKGFFPEKEIYYVPEKKVLLDQYLVKYLQSLTSENFLNANFVTNDRKFKRNTILKKYLPLKAEIQIIKDSFPVYIQNQFNRFCPETSVDIVYKEVSFESQEDFLTSKMKIDISTIKIDSVNSFVDSKGSKLITFIVHYFPLYRNRYPFNGNCFREDNRYEGFRISCIIDNKNNLRFLGDELNYLDHGDFDNDGKDEFLFWYSIFNHDKYVLFYDDFKKSIDFEWSYH